MLVDALESIVHWQHTKFSKFLHIMNLETPIEVLRGIFASYTDESKDTELEERLHVGTHSTYRKFFSNQKRSSKLTPFTRCACL